jgi:hypothetical protein
MDDKEYPEKPSRARRRLPAGLVDWRAAHRKKARPSRETPWYKIWRTWKELGAACAKCGFQNFPPDRRQIGLCRRCADKNRSRVSGRVRVFILAQKSPRRRAPRA